MITQRLYYFFLFVGKTVLHTTNVENFWAGFSKAMQLWAAGFELFI
jgi:hypothetical protein